MSWKVFLIHRGWINVCYTLPTETCLSEAIKDADAQWDEYWELVRQSPLAASVTISMADVVVAVYDDAGLPGSDPVYVRGNPEQLG